jgi:putative flavoprotein involved in K+ transport
VVATGPFQVPRTPPIAAHLDPRVVQLHASDYRRPSDIPDGTVLVVGGGNTGCQIAEELTRTHEVHLAVGTRQMPLPQRLLGRDLFWYLDRLGLMHRTVDSRLGRRMRDRETLVGTSPRAVRRLGGTVHPRAIDAGGDEVGLADGTWLRVDAVVWATGFGLDHTWIDAPAFDDAGRIVHERGVTPVPGLYVLGLPWLHTRGSALLGWVRHDAEHVAARIAAHAAPRAAAPAV